MKIGLVNAMQGNGPQAKFPQLLKNGCSQALSFLSGCQQVPTIVGTDVLKWRLLEFLSSYQLTDSRCQQVSTIVGPEILKTEAPWASKFLSVGNLADSRCQQVPTIVGTEILKTEAP